MYPINHQRFAHAAITQLSYVLSYDDFDISFYYRVYTFYVSKTSKADLQKRIEHAPHRVLLVSATSGVFLSE